MSKNNLCLYVIYLPKKVGESYPFLVQHCLSIYAQKINTKSTSLLISPGFLTLVSKRKNNNNLQDFWGKFLSQIDAPRSILEIFLLAGMIRNYSVYTKNLAQIEDYYKGTKATIYKSNNSPFDHRKMVLLCNGNNTLTAFLTGSSNLSFNTYNIDPARRGESDIFLFIYPENDEYILKSFFEIVSNKNEAGAIISKAIDPALNPEVFMKTVLNEVKGKNHFIKV